MFYWSWWNISDCYQGQTAWFGEDFDNQHLASKNDLIPEPEGETLSWFSCNIATVAGLSGELQRWKCCLRQQSFSTGTFGVVWTLLDSWLTLSTVAGLAALLHGHRGAAPMQRALAGRPWQSCLLLRLPAAQVRNASVGLHYEQEVMLCAVSASIFLVSISLIIFNSRICSLPMEGLWSLTVMDVQ